MQLIDLNEATGKLMAKRADDNNQVRNAQPSAGTISRLADMVVAGQIVEAALTDGTFSLLMEELRRRGMTLHPRTESMKQSKPFLFRVTRT